MKKLSIAMITAAIAAFSFTGCAVEEQIEPSQSSMNESTITVNFTTANPETKTAFGEFDEVLNSYPAMWTANDNTISMSLGLAEPVEALVGKTEEVSNSAKFTATFVDSGSPYEFYAMSPLSATNALSESRSSWTITVPTEQTPKADGLSCDESAMILYSKSQQMTSIPTDPIELKFSHVTTYCRLTLKNIASAFEGFGVEDASINTVDVTYSVPVAGDWYVDVADGSLTEKEASYTISIHPTITDLSQPTDIWYALLPCTLDGETVKVTVNSDKGSLIREYTFGTRTYVAGAVNKLTLDLTKNTTFREPSITVEETVYQLVTSLDKLSANDEVIFVDAVTPTNAMSKTADGTSGISSVSSGFSYSTTDGYIRLDDNTNVIVMTVASKSGSKCTFKSGSNYLASTATGNSHYASLGTSGKEFTVAISDGTAQMSYKSGSGKTTYSLYYNNNHFTYYSSTSSQIKTLAIYKKADVETSTEFDPDNDPIIGDEQFGAYLKENSLTHTFGVSQLSREYETNEVVFAILYPEENSVLEFSGIPTNAAKGDTFDLTVTKITGRKKNVLGTYNVMVVKESGSKLWLSDFGGNGFIVKR